VTLLAGMLVVPRVVLGDAAPQVPIEPCSAPSHPNIGATLPPRRDPLAPAPAAYGFEKPSAIQQRAIVPVIKGKDVIAQAQSGTGKTGTFAISILQRINLDDTDCQALILAPTRELAQQIQKVRYRPPVADGSARAELLWLSVGVATGPSPRVQRGRG
jgi:hypothetical protein